MFLSHNICLNDVKDHAVSGVTHGNGDLQPSVKPQADRYCVVAREGHADIRGHIETEQWRRTGHVFVASLSPSDELLAPAIGEDVLPRPSDVTATVFVPRWEMALEMVAGSDAIATGPRRLAEAQAARLGLQVLEPPQPSPPPWTVVMAYRDAPDPGLAWFRDQLRAALLG